MKTSKTKITIVTFYQVSSAESYTGAVKGVISEEDRQKMSTKFGVAGDDGQADNLFFCEIELKNNAKDLRTLLNVGDSGDVVNKKWFKKYGDDPHPTCPRCHTDTGSRGQCLAGCSKKGRK